jgi:hypothetical protein
VDGHELVTQELDVELALDELMERTHGHRSNRELLDSKARPSSPSVLSR